MKNDFQRVRDRVTIYLDSQQEKNTGRVIIDAEDLPKVFGYSKWRILRGRDKSYVVSNPWTDKGRIDSSKVVFLHRLVMGIEHRHIEVGFLNGDTFDCRKANLFCGRHVDIAQRHTRKPGERSSTGVANVYDCGASYQAQKTIYGKTHEFGRYATKEEAYAAVKKGTLDILKKIAQKGLEEKK